MSKKQTGCITCAIGCGVMVLIGIILLVSFTVWIQQKGSFDQTRSILSNEADFYVQLKLDEEEEALVAFFQQLTEQSNKQNPVFRKFPVLEKWNHNKTASDFRKLLPLRAEIQGSPVREDLQVSVGFSLYNRIASIAFYIAEKSAEKGGRLYHINQSTYIEAEQKGSMPFYIALNESIIYFATSRESMESLLTRDPATQETHLGSSYLMDLDLDSPVYGYLTHSAIQPDTLKYLGIEDLQGWEWFSNDIFSRIAMDMRVGDDGLVLVGKVLFDLADAGYRDLVREKLERFAEDLQMESKFDLSINLIETNNGMIMEYEMSNFELPAGSINAGSGIKIRTSQSHEE